MAHLYHGSGYKQPELKPGIMHTGKLQKWDKTESNEWLYATPMMEEAIAQGFASVIEKTWKLCRFFSVGNTVSLMVDGALPTMEQLQGLTVYLYKIDWDESVWVKVDNIHNGMESEYKTKSVIPATMIDNCVSVDIANWLKGKDVKIIPKNAAMRW